MEVIVCYLVVTTCIAAVMCRIHARPADTPGLFLCACSVLGGAALCCAMMEAGGMTMLNGSRKLSWLSNVRWLMLNLTVAAVVLAVLWVVTRRLWAGCFLTGAIFALYALVNHFTVKYHRFPITFNDVMNVGTAAQVAGSYEIKLDGPSALVLGLYILWGLYCLWLRRRGAGRLAVRRRWAVPAVCGAAGAVLWGCYFGSSALKPHNIMGWSWLDAYSRYGVTLCTMEALFENPVVLPKGYKAQKTAEMEMPVQALAQEQEKPDIILILNETLYDLSLITDLKADGEYLENFWNTENSVTGYAVVPNDGGGTNCSEYELLSGNPSVLLPGVTPFNTLDLNERATVVSALNQLGYATSAAHPEPMENYNRGNAYKSLGFAERRFVQHFKNTSQLAERYFKSDASVYANLIEWYEAACAQSAEPVFSYLLTIQNHGDWNSNPDSWDEVHARTDYGEENDSAVNEYLTCIRYSDMAWKELVDYFSAVERPVIICMVGDHSPSFANAICDPALTESGEHRLLLRSTPYILWSNSIDLSGVQGGTVSLNYLAPMLMQAAGLPLTPYYQKMMEMREDIPVITSYGTYVADGAEHTAGENESRDAAVRDYLYLAYNNMMEKSQNVAREWFFYS